jgi:hypothetical protein
MTCLLSLHVAYKLRELRTTYKIFRKTARFLSVALFSEMPALETEDLLASTLGPQQTCAALNQ